MYLGLHIEESEGTGGDKMKILFDVGVPHQLRRIIMKQGYSVETSQYHGWTLRDNGDLLDLAEQNGFQILITTDQSMEHELNLAKWKVGIVVLADTKWDNIKLHVADIVRAVEISQPGIATWVKIPTPPS